VGGITPRHLMEGTWNGDFGTAHWADSYSFTGSGLIVAAWAAGAGRRPLPHP